MINTIKETQKFLNSFIKANLVVDGRVGRFTNAAMQEMITRLKVNYFEANKYVWRSNRPNLIGFRMESEKFTNQYDDYFLVVTDSEFYAVPCSTKAGTPAVFNPVNPKGTGILVAGQYLNAYQFVTAQNWQTLWTKKPYFMQIGTVSVWRDNNKNLIIDKVAAEKGFFGINIHRGWGVLVFFSSAGCQVIPDLFWDELVVSKLFIDKQIYDYTLFEIKKP